MKDLFQLLVKLSFEKDILTFLNVILYSIIPHYKCFSPDRCVTRTQKTGEGAESWNSFKSNNVKCQPTTYAYFCKKLLS
jgi:hypothetical protein